MKPLVQLLLNHREPLLEAPLQVDSTTKDFPDVATAISTLRLSGFEHHTIIGNDMLMSKDKILAWIRLANGPCLCRFVDKGEYEL